MKKNWLIDGLRGGWGKELKSVMVNYHGQWYELDKNTVHDNTIIYKLLK